MSEKIIPKDADNNYCSDHDGDPGGAWCYTTDPNWRWDYCSCRHHNAVNLVNKPGQWFTYNGDTTQLPFVCSAPVSDTPEESPPDGACPPEWFSYQVMQFHITIQVNWITGSREIVTNSCMALTSSKTPIKIATAEAHKFTVTKVI